MIRDSDYQRVSEAKKLVRVYFTGHRTFENRGCEAIVRSTVGLLRKQFKEVEVLVPSDDIDRDKALWPDAESQGVVFVPAVTPWYARYWVHAQRLPISSFKRMFWPFPMSRSVRDALGSVDAVLSIGGDNYSLDYYLPSFLMGLDSAAMDASKPVILWGASVGPFEAEPAFVPVVQRHLQRMRLITARETATMRYLQQDLGLSNVALMADPAFTLVPESVDLQPFWPADSAEGVLGFNVSSLLERYRPKGEPEGRLLDEVAVFVKDVVENSGMSVLLIPHVLMAGKGNDADFMQGIIDRTGGLNGRVQMMGRNLNAAQTKFVVSRCRFLIAGRTHATIAGLSSSVPTISIAYSVKAKGINYDLFGHTDYVLETPKVNTETLHSAVARLLKDEDAIKAHLAKQLPDFQAKAADGVGLFGGI